jgi:hypothetical protein
VSTDSAGIYVRSVQQLVLRVAVVLAVILVIIGIPLLVSGSLRLDIAYRLNLVVGRDVEQFAGAGTDQTLIVVPITIPLDGGRVETAFQATYLARPVNEQIELTNLIDQSIVLLPIAEMDFIAADQTGKHLLFTQGAGASAHRVLVTVENGTVEELPAGVSEPDIPGDWSTSIWATRIGRTCLGISPQRTYIACFKTPTLARFLAGDWQIDVQRYGAYQQSREIFRGLGTRPIIGFTSDEQWLWFQNEEGIWREPMSLDMFS